MRKSLWNIFLRSIIIYRDELGLSSTIATMDDLLSLLVKDDISLCISFENKNISCHKLSLTDNYVYVFYYICSSLLLSSVPLVPL